MTVEIGINVPEASPPDVPMPDVAALARTVERCGLDGLWVSDRLMVGDWNVPDAGLNLATAAAVTSRITLGFGVYVPSMRPLARAAKQIAALQQLAGDGRLQLGVGLGGGSEQEYQAAGFRRADRARRTDAFLSLLPDLLGGRPVRIPDLPDAPEVRLRPAVPVPPVWIGGNSPAALRRAVRYGGGWLAGLPTRGEFADGVRTLRTLSDEAGRPRHRIGVGLHAALGSRPAAQLAELTAASLQSAYGVPVDRARELAIAGTPAQVADQLAPYVEAGAELIIVVCDPAPTAEACELLAETRRLLNEG
jgi:alkanesulfonate monooxygenase SsuD/methylene tetrahydromethanopterin reductase-like flavin-dependent oxidoreductase (luciferase family)